DNLRFAVAAVVTWLLYVGINLGVLAPMLVRRGIRLREVFGLESVWTELVIASLGLIMAAFWKFNPFLVPFAVLPLVLIHRALSVPQLQAEARVDPKTGLFNARHFANVLADELARAAR